MAANEIRLGDIGTVFEITIQDNGTVVDISEATTQEIIFKKPDVDTVVVKATSFVTDGSDGKIKYTVASGDLDVIGKWQIQARIVLPGGEWKSDIVEFQVLPNL